MGARERADVILPPFEMAVREGGVRSVMHSYTDTDGVPSAADPALLTGPAAGHLGLRRDRGLRLLRHRRSCTSLHGVAADEGDAAAIALAAGVDVELPTVNTFGKPLRDAIAAGRLPEETVDRALRRVLTQKAELGLLDPDWSPVPPALAGSTDLAGSEVPERLRGTVDLNRAAHRDIARRIAEEAVILLRNDGTLPLGSGSAPARIALVGPQAEAPTAVLGCYSFPVHIGSQHPDTPPGIELPTLRESLAAEFPGQRDRHRRGLRSRRPRHGRIRRRASPRRATPTSS